MNILNFVQFQYIFESNINEAISDSELINKIIGRGYKSQYDFFINNAHPLYYQAEKRGILNSNNIPGWNVLDKNEIKAKVIIKDIIDGDYQNRKELRTNDPKLYATAIRYNVLKSIPGFSDEDERKYKEDTIITKIENLGYKNEADLRKRNEALFRAAYRAELFNRVIWPEPLSRNLSDAEIISTINNKGFKRRIDFIKGKDGALFSVANNRGLLTPENIIGWKERPDYANISDDDIKNIIKEHGYKYKITFKNEMPGLYGECLRRGIDKFSNWEYPHNVDKMTFAYEIYRKDGRPWAVYVGVTANIKNLDFLHLSRNTKSKSPVSKFLISNNIEDSQIKTLNLTSGFVPISDAVKIECEAMQRYKKDYRWEILNTKECGSKSYGGFIK
jgi:hypothetical protein